MYGADVVHGAGDRDAGAMAQRAHRLGRAGADDVEPGVGAALQYLGEHGLCEPADGVGVRPVVHGAGEDQRFDVSWKRAFELQIR